MSGAWERTRSWHVPKTCPTHRRHAHAPKTGFTAFWFTFFLFVSCLVVYEQIRTYLRGDPCAARPTSPFSRRCTIPVPPRPHTYPETEKYVCLAPPGRPAPGRRLVDLCLGSVRVADWLHVGRLYVKRIALVDSGDLDVRGRNLWDDDDNSHRYDAPFSNLQAIKSSRTSSNSTSTPRIA